MRGWIARRLLDSDTGAVYASSGHLLFVRQDTLFAQQFDPDPAGVDRESVSRG